MIGISRLEEPIPQIRKQSIQDSTKGDRTKSIKLGPVELKSQPKPRSLTPGRFSPGLAVFVRSSAVGALGFAGSVAFETFAILLADSPAFRERPPCLGFS